MDSSMRMPALPAAWPGGERQWNPGAHAGRGVQRGESAPGRQGVHGAQVEHGHRHGHLGSESSGGAAYATLKIKIEQTLSKLAPPREGVEATADSAAADPVSFKARIDFSGPGGRLDARISLQGGAAGADFGAALKSFADAMFSALRTLHGQAPQAAAANTASAGTPALPSATGAAAVGDAPGGAAAGAATPAAAVAPSSLLIKLRLSYDSFDHQMGSLVERLAQPDVGRTTPALSDQLGELSSRFAQLMAAAAGAGSSQPTLGSFLSALAQSMAPPPATAPTVDTPPPPSTEAAAPRGAATLSYRQVMNLGDSTLSLSLRTRLGAGAVHAMA